MVKSVVILAGGNSFRLKPDTFTPKPLLKLDNGCTLLEHQIKWLCKYTFRRIIITTTKEVKEATENNLKFMETLPTGLDIIWCIEKDRLGTSGAVHRAFKYVDDKAYVMNVDDLIFNFNPLQVYNTANNNYSCILLSKPRMNYGMVETRKELVLNFREKPYLNFWVSAGHYAFSKIVVNKYFKKKGDLEMLVLPFMSKDRKLCNVRLRKDNWITINTHKDFMEAKERLNNE